MRVAFDPQAFTLQEYGGISRYVCSLAVALSRRQGVTPKIFAPLHINSYLAQMSPVLVFGKKIPRIPKTLQLRRAINQILVRPALRSFRPDIVHETYYSPEAYAPSTARRVVTVHDMIHERIAGMIHARDQTSNWKQFVTKRADHVICISESTRRDLLELMDFPENKVTVVYHGFDLLPRIARKSDIEAKETKPYLLYVGQRRGYKNFDCFLLAYASSPWLRNNFDVMCFGGGAFSGTEIKHFRALGLCNAQLIHRRGNDHELADCYRNAAVFVYPSLYEGFGIPLLEAMSLDCPVVCSSRSSIPEVAGNAAEYFDPKDADSIRGAMERVLNSAERRAALIAIGQLRCSIFSWERCANETLAIYRALM